MVSCKAMVSISDSKEMYYMESGAPDHLTLHEVIYIANRKFDKPVEISAANRVKMCLWLWDLASDDISKRPGVRIVRCIRLTWCSWAVGVVWEAGGPRVGCLPT